MELYINFRVGKVTFYIIFIEIIAKKQTALSSMLF